MKTKLFLVGVGGLCLSVSAGELQFSTANQTSQTLDTRWDYSITHWDHVLSQRPTTSELQIGKSDFVVRGPLIDGFRYERNTDRSLGQKLLGLPVVRLFVPQRMPTPPGGTGHYFAWKAPADRPWVATPVGAPPGAAFNGAYSEAKGTLISVGH